MKRTRRALTGLVAFVPLLCAGLPGDGVVGHPLSYEDCGDGTVADLNTGFMWEQKVRGGDETTCLTELHGVDSACDWFEATGEWIDAVNAEGYAGYSDWRLPHVKELQSIVDYSTLIPAVQPEFAWVNFFFYWSATSVASDPVSAWRIYAGFGSVGNAAKDERQYVRAVRDGACPPPARPTRARAPGIGSE
jgi:hypothetical protein